MFVWEPNSDSLRAKIKISRPGYAAAVLLEAWKRGKVQQQCRGSRDAAVAKSTPNLQDAAFNLVRVGFVAGLRA